MGIKVDWKSSAAGGFLFLYLAVSPVTHGAVHAIPAEVQTIDCRTYMGGVNPGDTLMLAAGERDALRISHCKGIPGNPISIRNDVTGTGPVIIRRGSAKDGDFVFHVLSSEYFEIDGTGGWSGSKGHCGWLNETLGTNCGIAITRIIPGDSPSSFLKFTGFIRNYTVKGIHIDGRFWGDGSLAVGEGAGIGIHQRSSELASQNPGYWQENIVYERNYIHNTRRSAFYLGANHSASPDTPLRNITVQDNYVHTTGRNGISLKSAIDGNNVIRRNYIKKSGLERTTNGGRGGITAFESTHVDMYNNVVIDTFSWCFGVYTHLMPEGYPLIGTNRRFYAKNNLAVACGSVGEVDRGHGIYIGANTGAPVIENIEIDYNTIVDSGPTTAIGIGSRITGAYLKIRNNIVANDNAGGYISDKGIRENNLTGTVKSFFFSNPTVGDYKLKIESRAVNVGTAPFPEIDLKGSPRPFGNGPDVGAFEFTAPTVGPKPPIIAVQ